MVFEQRTSDFIQYLRFEKRSAHHTVTAYSSDLDQFREYIEGKFGPTDPVDLNHFHIRSWLATLSEGGLSPKSVNRKMSTLNSFFLFLYRLQLIKANPMRKLHSMKLPERVPTYLKESETERLLEDLDFGEGFKGFTERLVCELLYLTGMRNSELRNLKTGDIEWGFKQIRILGKGNKERLVPVSDQILKKLREYMVQRNVIARGDHDHLLVLENGKPLYSEYVYEVVKRNLGLVTTQKKKSPHVLRHTFATHLLNNGASIQAIKELLGHSSLASTQIYAHNNIDKLKEIHRLSHPRG